MVGANGLQVQLPVIDLGNISGHIDYGRGNPAGIIQLIKSDMQPIAINIPPTNSASIALIQIRRVEISH